MNKLEKYSLHSALQSCGHIEIQDAFYPIGNVKYITFNTSNKAGSQYPYWNEVIQLIKPYLDAQDISIYRIGEISGFSIDNVKNFAGCSFNQNAFIIKNSLMHFNFLDEYSLASYNFKIPSVCVSPNFDDGFFPFAPRDSFFILHPNDKKFPSLISNYQESVSKLNPEVFAKSILDKLNLQNDLSSISLVYNGSMAHIPTIEVVPDFSPRSDLLMNSTLNIRFDLHQDEQNLLSWSRNRKLGIVTDTPISTNCLYHIKNSLIKLSINADNGIDENFLRSVKALNIQYDIFLTESSNLQGLRLKFIDETVECFPLPQKKDLDLVNDICDNGIIRSSKILLSKGKKFSSKAHWILGSEQTGGFEKIIDTKDFWLDSEFFYIYQKNEQIKN